MIVKKIVFQVVNSFASLFFIAFVKPIYFPSYYQTTLQSEINTEVSDDLQIQLAILFLSLIFIQNAQEVLMSTLILRFCKAISPDNDTPPHTLDKGQPQLKQELISNNLGEAYSPYSIKDLRIDAELQINQPRASNVMDNMSELIIEQGYATMFAIAFPLASVLAFANNFGELRVDSRNLIVNQRPIPYAAYGVGLWGEVLVAFCGISIVTNWALFVFRTNQIELFFDTDDSRILSYVFLIGVGVIFLLIFILYRFPSEIDDTHLERTKEIEKYLIIKGVTKSAGDESIAESVEIIRAAQSSPLNTPEQDNIPIQSVQLMTVVQEPKTTAVSVIDQNPGMENGSKASCDAKGPETRTEAKTTAVSVIDQNPG